MYLTQKLATFTPHSWYFNHCMRGFEELKVLIEKGEDAVIIPHQKPDADALGSCLGLARYLQKKGCNTTVISPTDYPEFLHWMAGNDDVLILNEDNEEGIATIIKKAPLIFCLDFCDLKRINELGHMVDASNAKIALIDHHLFPKDFAQFVLSDTSAAATAELIYDFILMMGDKDLIDIPLAECLYAGIMTDTGSFRFPSTSKKVHLIVAELIGMGLEVAKIHQCIYDSNSEDRLRFLGFCLNERLHVNHAYHTAYFAISHEDLLNFNIQTGDTEGLVNYALSIKGIVFASIMIDRGEAVKFSFRSVGDFSVNEFARDNFDGGGHKNASGGISYESFEDTKAKFEALLPQYSEKLEEVYNNEKAVC